MPLRSSGSLYRTSSLHEGATETFRGSAGRRLMAPVAANLYKHPRTGAERDQRVKPRRRCRDKKRPKRLRKVYARTRARRRVHPFPPALRLSPSPCARMAPRSWEVSRGDGPRSGVASNLLGEGARRGTETPLIHHSLDLTGRPRLPSHTSFACRCDLQGPSRPTDRGFSCLFPSVLDGRTGALGEP